MKPLVELAEHMAKNLVDTPEAIIVKILDNNGTPLMVVTSEKDSENKQLVGVDATTAKAFRLLIQKVCQKMYKKRIQVLVGPRR